MPVEKNEKGVMVAVTIHPFLINQISSVKIFLPKDLKSSDSKKAVMKSLEQVQKRFENVPLIDPIKDMKINEKSFKEIGKQYAFKKYDQFILNTSCSTSESNIRHQFKVYSRNFCLENGDYTNSLLLKQKFREIII